MAARRHTPEEAVYRGLTPIGKVRITDEEKGLTPFPRVPAGPTPPPKVPVPPPPKKKA